MKDAGERSLRLAEQARQANAPSDSAAIQDPGRINAAPRHHFLAAAVCSPGKERPWERELLANSGTWWPSMNEKYVGLRAFARGLVSTGQSLRTSLRWSHSASALLPTEYT